MAMPASAMGRPAKGSMTEPKAPCATSCQPKAAADRLARLTPPSCYVFLASNVDSSYIAGQTLHTNGGVVVHG